MFTPLAWKRYPFRADHPKIVDYLFCCCLRTFHSFFDLLYCHLVIPSFRATGNHPICRFCWKCYFVRERVPDFKFLNGFSGHVVTPCPSSLYLLMTYYFIIYIQVEWFKQQKIKRYQPFSVKFDDPRFKDQWYIVSLSSFTFQLISILLAVPPPPPHKKMLEIIFCRVFHHLRVLWADVLVLCLNVVVHEKPLTVNCGLDS